jgi:peroxisomal membrane protein 4
MVKVPVKRQVVDAPQNTFPIFAAVVWGLVMVMTMMT